MSNYVAARVVAVPVCRPARPRKGASIVRCAERIGGNMLFAHGNVSFADGNATFAGGNTSFWYGNAAAQTFGRAHRHRPYGFVWADCMWVVDVVWVDCVWTVGFVWVDCVCGFVCWESGAHEPTPSVLYFCQPRVD